ncbi:OpgC domain-containing protein [Trinickia mobilis]|uniref:OpgC domain-containing protein n=1 Tax=Trinickia mobilis TaxID=2816356 RepID=UPI001A8EEE43|nr:OpgC domain-containing protein [Trinickia mobilis]
MTTQSSRFIELDFLRGLVLLMIVVDHIGGSILSRFTLHTYALNDASEVFVFLGGYSAALAYAAIERRHTAAAAARRFVKRAWEIYLAFVITAMLMFATALLFSSLAIDAPNLAPIGLDLLFDAPLRTFNEVLTLHRQPYLASVLPMYVLFALAAPAMFRMASTRPLVLLATGVALWLGARRLGLYLPTAEESRWSFNPFAWQLMFVLGVLCKRQPVFQMLRHGRFAPHVSMAALAIVAGVALYKLVLDSSYPPGDLKFNLAFGRIANFLALAWFTGLAIERGWIAKLAQRLPAVCTIGKNGLIGFVTGAVISLALDALLYDLTGGLLHIPLGLAADALAIGMLLAAAKTLPGLLARGGALIRQSRAVLGKRRALN